MGHLYAVLLCKIQISSPHKSVTQPVTRVLPDLDEEIRLCILTTPSSLSNWQRCVSLTTKKDLLVSLSKWFLCTWSRLWDVRLLWQKVNPTKQHETQNSTVRVLFQLIIATFKSSAPPRKERRRQTPAQILNLGKLKFDCGLVTSRYGFKKLVTVDFLYC